MKGQLSVEFFTAIFIFIVFVTYFIFQIMNVTPTYLNEMEMQRLRSEAYQVSELLVNDLGYPINWDTLGDEQINRIGLSDSSKNLTNVLSTAKVNALALKCSTSEGYRKLVGWIDTSYRIAITITKNDGSSVVCNSAEGVSTRYIVSLTRVVAFDSGIYGKLLVQMW